MVSMANALNTNGLNAVAGSKQQLQGPKFDDKNPQKEMLISIFADEIVAKKPDGKVSRPDVLKDPKMDKLIAILLPPKKLNPLQRKFDFNHDGRLNAIEKLMLMTYLRLRRFDINHDGRLDKSELKAMEVYEKFRRFDFDRNGKLDYAEKAAMLAYELSTKKGKKRPKFNPLLMGMIDLKNELVKNNMKTVDTIG